MQSLSQALWYMTPIENTLYLYSEIEGSSPNSIFVYMNLGK